MPKASRFKFRKYDTIGNVAAESDDRFLATCFVDTGATALLTDCRDQRGIVLGRTGTGKTALLKHIQATQEQTVEINPHDIALSYISNSPVFRFFETAGLNIDEIYRFLWRHVLVVEVLKMRFNLDSESQRPGWWDQTVYTLLRKKTHQDAFKYLNTMGSDFVATTDKQIKDVTIKIERDLTARAGVQFHDILQLGAEGARRLTEEQRYEVRQIGQEFLNTIQVNKLATLFRALDEDLLTDPKRHYYIVIDHLDETWIDDHMRYRLVRALIEIVRDFNSKLRTAKAIIALRTDLFDRMLSATTDSGFQAEKYRGLCLPLSWDKRTLIRMLDLRINELVRDRYTSEVVTHRHLLPGTVGKKREQPIDFMLDRTLFRPRDIIAFFNLCADAAAGEPKIGPQLLTRVESTHSDERLSSLCDEWSVEYPYLREVTKLLYRRPISFLLSEIREEQLDELALLIYEQGNPKDGDDARAIEGFYQSRCSSHELRVYIAQILYRVGAVGLKHESHGQILWSYTDQAELPANQITEATKLYPHKMLWRALGVSA